LAVVDLVVAIVIAVVDGLGDRPGRRVVDLGGRRFGRGAVSRNSLERALSPTT